MRSRRSGAFIPWLLVRFYLLDNLISGKDLRHLFGLLIEFSMLRPITSDMSLPNDAVR